MFVFLAAAAWAGIIAADFRLAHSAITIRNCIDKRKAVSFMGCDKK